MTFLKRYSYSAVSLNYVTSCLVILEAVLACGWAQQGWGAVAVDLPLLIDAAFAAGAAMISFGAVLGKATPAQLVWLLALEVPLYAANAQLVAGRWGALDVGGSITIHAFGAVYGVAAAAFLAPRGSGSAHPKSGASYVSDMTAMLGTIFLFIYWCGAGRGARGGGGCGEGSAGEGGGRWEGRGAGDGVLEKHAGRMLGPASWAAAAGRRSLPSLPGRFRPWLLLSPRHTPAQAFLQRRPGLRPRREGTAPGAHAPLLPGTRPCAARPRACLPCMTRLWTLPAAAAERRPPPGDPSRPRASCTARLYRPQVYCIMNTVVALLGAVLAAFAASAAATGKLDMVHIQNATLAGGVAIGSSANLAMPPACALAGGCCCAAASCVPCVGLAARGRAGASSFGEEASAPTPALPRAP